MDSLKKIVGRIQQRLDAVGLTAAAASREAGLSDSAIYNLKRGAAGKIKTKGANATTFAKLAPVLKTTVAWLTEGEPDKAESVRRVSPKVHRPTSGSAVVAVPLLDSVTAGKLAAPSSQIPVEDVPLLAFADLGSGEFFALRVDGSSMNRISPESSVIVVNRRDKQLVNGKAYVFSIRGETTYKLWQGGDPSYLAPHSFDESHKPIFIKKKKDLEVIGRVKRSVLDL